MAAAPVPNPDYALKRETFSKSYAEVLAAIKHQDDKLGRQLTALAFLTGAAISLFSKFGADTSIPTALPGSKLSVAAFCFITFAVGAGLSLIFALAAIGPTRGLPPFGRHEERPSTSVIFFGSIAADEKRWKSFASDYTHDDLDLLLAEDYHLETLGLARRVGYKQAWSRQAGACLQLAIAALAVLAIFVSSSFSIGTRWWMASGVLVVVSLVPLGEYLYMQLSEYPEKEPFRWTYPMYLLLPALSATLLYTATFEHTYWIALPFALFGAILAPRLATIQPKWTVAILAAACLWGFISFAFVLQRLF